MKPGSSGIIASLFISNLDLDTVTQLDKSGKAMSVKRQLQWHQKDYSHIEMTGKIQLEHLPKDVLGYLIKKVAHPDDPHMLLTYPLYQPEYQVLSEYIGDRASQFETGKPFLSIEDNNSLKRQLQWCSTEAWQAETSAVRDDEWTGKKCAATMIGHETLLSVPEGVMNRIVRLMSDKDDPEMMKTYKFNQLFIGYLMKLNPYIQHKIRDDVFDYWITSVV